MTKTAAIYARYSTNRQNAVSIDDQISQGRILAERHGYEVVAVYKDAAKSGEGMVDRDGLQALKEDAKKGKFDALFVEAVNRLGRDEEDIHHNRKRFDRWGIKVFTINGEMADINWSVDGLVAAQNNKAIRIHTRRAMNAMVRDRGLSPTKIPYGYRGIPETLPNGLNRLKPGVREIDPDKRHIVLRWFVQRSNGATYEEIAHGLTRDGIPAPRGGARWTAEGIKHFLENPIYIGKVRWNKHTYYKDLDTRQRAQEKGKPEDLILVDAPHLRIVPQDLWDQVQSMRGKKRRSYTFKTAEQYFLAGMLRCAACGGSMVIGQNNADGSPRVVCSRADRRSGCDHRKSYCLTKLQAAVLRGMKTELSKPERLIAYTKEYHARWAERQKEIRSDRDTVAGKLAVATRKRDRWLDMIDDGDETLPRAELKKRLATAESERLALEEQLVKIENETNVVDLHPQTIERFCKQITELHDALSGNVPVEKLPPFHTKFRTIFAGFTVLVTGRRQDYLIKPDMRLSAITGIDLFPEIRSSKQILEDEGLSDNRLNGPSRTRRAEDRNCGTIPLGVWKQAA